MNQWNFPSYYPNQNASQQSFGGQSGYMAGQQGFHQQPKQTNMPYGQQQGQSFHSNQSSNQQASQPKSPYEQFAKPPLPINWYQQQSMQQQQMPNQMQGTPPQGPKNMMTYFQDENGQLDLDKMLSTVGQMVNTVNQISPLVKGIGSFMKGVK